MVTEVPPYQSCQDVRSFRFIPGAKTVKNRIHFDWIPTERTRDDEVERIVGLGATLYEDHRRADGWAGSRCSIRRATSSASSAGCDVYRYNADDLDTAIARAVLEFYTTGTDTITRAIAEFQATHTAATAGHRDQLAAVARELKEANASVDRYLTAFEKGTLDDED